MHSLLKRPSSLAPCSKPYHNEQTPHTHCYSRILFVIFYPQDCSQVRGSGSTMFYEKWFRFRLLKKSNASEFASSFFLQSASASTKI